MTNIAILASGRGSNAKALIEKAKEFNNLNIALIVTDNKDAGVIEHAKNHQIDFAIIEKLSLSKAEHEQKILETLLSHNIQWIFLAGYMKLLSPDFIKVFYDAEFKQSRIINIHPAYLPEFTGLKAYERAFAADQDYSGITVHFVDAGMDTGPIIVQEKFEKRKDDTLEKFKKRGLNLEHKLYPKVLENLNHYLAKKDRRILYAL